MQCVACSHQNPANSKFCLECGTPFTLRCPQCGSDLPVAAKFCNECGHALRPPALGARPFPSRSTHPEQGEARKVVTIVFADLVGSTSLHERLDAESARRVMERYYAALRGAIDAHRGTLVKLLGDGVMAAFGVPQVAEDDALRAVRAAVEAVHVAKLLVVGSRGEEPATTNNLAISNLSIRVGVNTGEVVVSADNTDIVGDPVNVAARLQQEAPAGGVLIGEATRRLVADAVTLERAGVFALKGRAETVAAYRVVSLERPAGTTATAFVGRDEELRRLLAVHAAAVGERRARLGVILGSPGLGKSRLLEEVGRQVSDGGAVLTARCEAAGGATFAPVAAAVRAWLRSAGGAQPAESDDPPETGAAQTPALRTAIAASLPDIGDRERVADGIAALLAGTPASPEETFFVVRRFLTALAATQPVVLAIDDLQWAEPLLLDLVEHLIQWGSGVSMLVVIAARPELREARSSLTTTGPLVSEVVTLTGLDASAATRLAANVIGAEALPAAVAGRVLATSEGNPLFVGELVRMLVDDGTLKKEGERWTMAVDLASVEMPPTIHALLAARIERLRPEDRAVLERAAVVGRQFSRSAVAHLLPANSGHLDARLEALRRSELIEPDTAWFLGEPALRFHHGLTRDAAYRRLLKETRAELHGQLAEWIEQKVGESVEHEELLGWHLEQAYQHRRELGSIDAMGRAIGDKAARHLGAAGRRALARDDVPVAADLLGRALAVLDPADAGRGDLALERCEALLATGDVARAKVAIDELDATRKVLRVREEDDPTPNSVTPNPVTARLSAWHTCFTAQLAVLTDPQALRSTVDAIAAAAAELAKLGDSAGEAKAHQVHAQALQRLGEVGAAETALDKALAAARHADDRRRANAVLAGAPQAALWGPSPVTRASGRCLDVVRVLRITQGAPAVEAVALRCQAVLEALRGRTDAARRMISASRKMVEELGITQQVLETDVYTGLIELLEENAAAAETVLRAAYDGFRARGLAIDAARAAALLGRALFLQGNVAEAEALSRESEALAGDDLQAAIAWRQVRAETLAARREHAAAVEVARAAVDIASATDALLLHANARMALAAALRAAGRNTEAAAEEGHAVDLWQAKGATRLVDGAQPMRADVPEPAPVASSVSVRAPSARRVGENVATAVVGAGDEMLAKRDFDAIGAMLSAAYEEIHHPMQAVYGREEAIASIRRLLRSRDVSYRVQPLAVLGDRLVLGRRRIHASASGHGRFDVGEYENDTLILVEVDEHGRYRHVEVFASDKLGDTVVRLYERYAELLPEGSERERAAAIARTIGAYCGRLDADAFATTWAPDVEYVDRRRIGMGSVRGIAALRQIVTSLIEAAPDTANRIDQILAIKPDAWLWRMTNLGTDRTTGGTYERPQLMLTVNGPDGLVTRIEQFDLEQEDEAFARFDALTRPAPARRRVRPNAATAAAARLDAAMATRDADALRAIAAEEGLTIDHPNGCTYDATATLRTRLAVLRARDLRFSQEPLATLGDSLALFRMSMSASGVAGQAVDVGPYSRDLIILVDGSGGKNEMFAADHLSDAVVRLYERYSELLSAGPERERSAATARTVAVAMEPLRPDSTRAILAPSFEFIDHRRLGFGSVSGVDSGTAAVDAFVRGVGALYDLAENVTARHDTVLGLRPNALLVCRTTLGTDRASGGTFERQYLQLWGFGSDGRVTRLEFFDTSGAAQALARFDELATESRAVTVTRRVRPNAATANVARVDAAVAARDADALRVLFANLIETVDHPTGVTFERQGALTTMLSLLKARDTVYTHEPLATLGERLALCRTSTSSSGFAAGDLDVGPIDRESVSLIEVAAHGHRTRSEIFAETRLADAVGRLYERYAELLPAGPERDRAAVTARSISLSSRPQDGSISAADLFADDVEFVDHRLLGMPSARGAETVMRGARTLFEVGRHVRVDVHDVVALEPDAYLLMWTTKGIDRSSGGDFESTFLLLQVFGPDGRMTRVEFFDVGREAEALAHFDELTDHVGVPAKHPSESPLAKERTKEASACFANASTRFNDRFTRAWAARNWDAVTALHSPAHHNDDRRRLMQMRVAAEANLAQLRTLFEVPRSRMTMTAIATRGERLALSRILYEGSVDGGGGSLAIDYLGIVDVDTDERLVEIVLFDVHDLDAAYVELDDRYAAGEGKPYAELIANQRAFTQAIAANDAQACERLLPDDLTMISHRRFASTGEVMWREQILAGLRVMEDLNARGNLRPAHVRLSPSAGLVAASLAGTLDGGPFEIELVAVLTHDGRWPHAFELFDPDQLDEARACFDKLTNTSVSPSAGAKTAEGSSVACLENAAARSWYHFVDAWEGRDWARLVALHAPGCRTIDHRKVTRIDMERDEQLQTLRFLFDMHTEWFLERLLATRGDRLALLRAHLEASDSTVGPSDVDFLQLTELDEHGLIRELVLFDPNDLDAAYTEIEERYAAGEAAPFADTSYRTYTEMGQAVGARDWARVSALFAPDVIFQDNRLLGFGSTRSRDDLTLRMRSLVDLAPDAQVRSDHVLGLHRHGWLMIGRSLGTREGGAFESEAVNVFAIDADGRVTEWHSYDVAQLDAARARFAQLDAVLESSLAEGKVHESASKARALLTKPNAATAAMDRFGELLAARDWDGMRAACTPDAKLDDRRRLLAREPGPLVSNLQAVVEVAPDVRYDSRLIGRAGERVALECHLSVSGPPEAPAEIEYLCVTEVDDAGRIADVVLFDVDDWRAANHEARQRWFAIDPTAAAGVGPYAEYIEAANDNDRARLLALLAEDLVVDDHRRAGMGRIEGVEAYAQSLTALTSLARDIEVNDGPSALACAHHGSVRLVRRRGTMAEGGGDFESDMIVVTVVAGGRIQRMELFEVEDVDAALARFEELRPDPARIAANAATRARDRTWEAFEARDWNALRSLATNDFVYADRRKHVLVRGDVEFWITAMQLTRLSRNIRLVRELIGTAGDRVALQEGLWTGGPRDGQFEIATIMLTEVDAEGRLRASINFDVDDRRAAYAEAQARFVAGEAAGVGSQAVIAAFGSAAASHDWEVMRACMAPDLVIHDHSTLGLGVVRSEEFIQALRAQAELAPDAGGGTLQLLEWNRHGRVDVVLVSGTMPNGGGPFEKIYLRVLLVEGDRICHFECFDLVAAEQARARFEELCAAHRTDDHEK